MITEAELWAQGGVDNLCDPYRMVGVVVSVHPDGSTSNAEDVEPRKIDHEEALMLMRAAYAQGYQAALEEDPPLDLETVAARAETLALMLPA